MPKTITFLLFTWLSLSTVKAQAIPAIKVDDLLNRIGQGRDTTYLINFWATWCAPCVRELPQFEKINEQYLEKGIKVMLVSLDFKKDYMVKLPAFIEKRGIKSDVLFLDEQDANLWIPRIHPDWTGAIPATWIVNSSRQINDFVWSEWDEGELEKWLLEKVLDK